MEQSENREGRGPSNNNDRHKGTPRKTRIEDVNFDEMNFEQRRAPYNSGERNCEKQYDSDRSPKSNRP